MHANALVSRSPRAQAAPSLAYLSCLAFVVRFRAIYRSEPKTTALGRGLQDHVDARVHRTRRSKAADSGRTNHLSPLRRGRRMFHERSSGKRPYTRPRTKTVTVFLGGMGGTGVVRPFARAG